MDKLTVSEDKFYHLLRKELLFSNIKITKKVSIEDICVKNNILLSDFEKKTIKDVVIDFILSKGKKIIAGIEIVDEVEEMNNLGDKLLKDTIFTRLNSEYFRVIDLDKLGEAVRIIKEKVMKS